MINWHSGAKQRCATQLEDLKEDDPEECLNIYFGKFSVCESEM